MRSAGEASSRIEAIRASSGASSSREMVAADGGGGGGQEVTLGMIRPGYRVVVPRLGSGSMEVAEVDASRKEVTVSSGAFRARVKVAEVSSVSRPRRSGGLVGHAAGSALARRQAASAASAGGGRERLALRTSANTVDVRGERVEDAEAKVDLAISRAISSGKVWVIHGHGTGRLRTGLRTYLSQHSSVER
jgi:DNA mismatch repair protein MutS2